MDELPHRTSYTIRTPAFEGPFALVLELIEKRKLLVNDFSLSQITDDFIQHVRSQAEFPIEDAAEFIQVAATLLLIKSRSLIPDLELSGEEEQDVDDLKRRLEAYEKVRDHPIMEKLRGRYRTTLADKPWRKCDCRICRDVGIEVMIFRASNRNKRRGIHNLAAFKTVVDALPSNQNETL